MRCGPRQAVRHACHSAAMYMDADGSNCRVGARRIASDMAVDKSTAARLLDEARSLGWLQTDRKSKHSRTPNWWPSIPSAVQLSAPTGQSSDTLLSREAGQSLSAPTGQSATEPLSALAASTVRIQPPNCPHPRDTPPLTSLNLKEQRRDTRKENEIRNEVRQKVAAGIRTTDIKSRLRNDIRNYPWLDEIVADELGRLSRAA